MNLSEMANRIVELENLNANLARQLEQVCEERDALKREINMTVMRALAGQTVTLTTKE